MRAMLWRLWAAAVLCPLAWLAARAAPPPDLVFHAPDVQVSHLASSRAVGTGAAPRSDSRAGDQPPYQEFFIEHDVSTANAKKAARELNVSLVPWQLPGCGRCSRREVEYCEARLVADHCCCERRHFAEPFPYIPHSCYAGARACRPLAADCAQYTRIRDCCCARRLAEKWKGIMASSHRTSSSMTSLLLPTLYVIWRL